MIDQTPIEKLQPCLLDRLTDDEPALKGEGRAQRVVSLQKYRRGVLRDLEWLFNAHGYFNREDAAVDLHDYPEAYKSVINYGVRQLCGVTTPNLEILQEQLSKAIEVFEPRIMACNLTIQADTSHNIATLEIKGDLWMQPLPEQLHVKSTLDLENGNCMIGDAPHG
jgi:type VI secretion system protein ImpF